MILQHSRDTQGKLRMHTSPSNALLLVLVLVPPHLTSKVERSQKSE